MRAAAKIRCGLSDALCTARHTASLRVANQKMLEAKQISVDFAKKDAEIEIERARGIAKANIIVNESLTAQ